MEIKNRIGNYPPHMSDACEVWDSNQSQSIDILRFPLAIAVIFIHSSPAIVNIEGAPFSLLSAQGLYNLSIIILSKVLASCAVPTFFLISGFLFFRNFTKWSWNGYTRKLKSRVKTLIIPYFSWNALVFLSVILLKIKNIHLGEQSWLQLYDYIKDEWMACFWDYSKWETLGNIIGYSTYNTAPIDIPLWFLRDLIIMVLLSPIIYCYIKKCKIGGILLLLVAYLTNIWISVPGFSIAAFFFFSLGAYFAINNMNIVLFSRMRWLIFIPLSVICFIPCVWLCGVKNSYAIILHGLYIITTVFSLLSLSSWIVERYNISPKPFLVNSCFFIYASHTIFILAIAGGILNLIIPGAGIITLEICYLATPFLTAGICLAVYYILTKYLKPIAVPFTGRR